MSFPLGLARKGPEVGQFTHDCTSRTVQDVNGALRRLQPQHNHMARLVACGAKPGELAQITGFTPAQVTRIINSQLFIAAVQRLTGEIEENIVYNIREELESLANRSLEIVSEDMERIPESHQERVQRSRVAFEVLDRAGYAKKDTGAVSLHLHKHEHRDVSTMGTDELLQDVLELNRE